MRPHLRRQPYRQLDGEHPGRLRHRNRPTSGSAVDVPAGLPLRQPEPAGQLTGRISHQGTIGQQVSGRVDPRSVLIATSPTTTNHDINILPNMSHASRDTRQTFQPPVTERYLEAEVAHCVGGVLSPLLANIALEVLDEHFAREWEATSATRVDRARRRRHGQPVFRLVRYADDFVVLVSGNREHAEAVRQQTADVLAPMGLRLSEEKTTVVHIDEGFDFLGFRIQRHRKPGTSKSFVYTFPARKSVASVRRKVKTITQQGTNQPLSELLKQLNPLLRGWTRYFQHGVSKRAFGYLRHYTWTRVVGWLRNKHRKTGWKALRRRYSTQGWWPHDAGVELFNPMAVAVTRYRYRGNISTPWAEPAPA